MNFLFKEILLLLSSLFTCLLANACYFRISRIEVMSSLSLLITAILPGTILIVL